MAKTRILLVEDQRDVADALIGLVEASGDYQVVSVVSNDGDLAAAVAASTIRGMPKSFGLVITDGLDKGCMVVKTAADSPEVEVPILLITATPNEYPGFPAGHVLQKPVSLIDLIAKLTAMVKVES